MVRLSNDETLFCGLTH